MTHTVIQQLLDGLELREWQLAEQAGELAVRLRELGAGREALAITGKTIRAMAPDLEQPLAPSLPDGAACQQIMDVFDHERRLLRARPVPGAGPVGRAQTRRRHPRETQTPGQSWLPPRERTLIVRTTPP